MKPYRAISTDDHLMEAADGYTSRMSTRWGDKIPHVKDAGDGTDAWYVFGRGISSLTGFSFVQGVTPDRGVVTRWADVPKSAYVPCERVKAMDADGVDVHSFYPNIGNVQTLNHPEAPEALRLEALRACNEIQIEEYVRHYPGRFIALAVVPLWDPVPARHRGPSVGTPADVPARHADAAERAVPPAVLRKLLLRAHRRRAAPLAGSRQRHLAVGLPASDLDVSHLVGVHREIARRLHTRGTADDPRRDAAAPLPSARRLLSHVLPARTGRAREPHRHP